MNLKCVDYVLLVCFVLLVACGVWTIYFNLAI